MASRNASFHERGFAGSLLAPLKGFALCALMLFALMLAAWVVDWVMVFKVWPDGLARLQTILSEDLHRATQLGSGYSESPRFVTGMANLLYELLFKVTSIHDMGARFGERAALAIPDTIARNTYIANFEAIQVAMVGTQLFGVRLATLLMATPLFALGYCVALADGLAQRAIRSVSGGRESASLYHRAKHLQVVLLAVGGTITLLLPASFDPLWISVPGVAALAIFTRLQWSYYKKHL